LSSPIPRLPKLIIYYLACRRYCDRLFLSLRKNHSCYLITFILNASPSCIYLPSLMPHLFRIFHPYYLTLSVLSYCIALKYIAKIQPTSVISTSPCASSLFNKRPNNNNTIKTISPHGKDGKDFPIQSRRWEQGCNISVIAVPDIREKEVDRHNPSSHCHKSSQRQEIGHHHQWRCYLSAIHCIPGNISSYSLDGMCSDEGTVGTYS